MRPTDADQAIVAPAEIGEAQRLREKVAEQDKTIAALRSEVELLKKRLMMMYADRKRHQVDAEGQLTLFAEEADDAEELVPQHANEAPDGEERDDPIKKRHKPKRVVRELEYSKLDRESVTHELPEDQRLCPTTGLALVPIGEEMSEQLEYRAARLVVIEHIRIVYGLPPEAAEERQVKPLVAPLPVQPVEGCMAGPLLLAQILVQKYGYHLPLYRQKQVFQDTGLQIPQQTLCDWVLAALWKLRPIAAELMRQIRAGPVTQLDDTVVKCRRPKGSGYFQGYLWTFANPAVKGVAFAFTPGRGTEHIVPLIEGLEGFLVSDGYAGQYSGAREVGGNIIHSGCYAHYVEPDVIHDRGSVSGCALA